MAKQLVYIDRLVSTRSDSPSDSHQRKYSCVSLVAAFFNPKLLWARTPLCPNGCIPATLADVLHDWRRCFVLYSDWLRAMPMFNILSFDDQVCFSFEKICLFRLALPVVDSHLITGGCMETGRRRQAVTEFVTRMALISRVIHKSNVFWTKG